MSANPSHFSGITCENQFILLYIALHTHRGVVCTHLQCGVVCTHSQWRGLYTLTGAWSVHTHRGVVCTHITLLSVCAVLLAH